MTEAQIVSLLIKEVIFDLPAEDQDKVYALVAELRTLLRAHPNGHAHLALALIGAEQQI